MATYAIIELEDGLTIATVEPGQTPEAAAEGQGGVLVDPGPFDSYEDAYDAMLNLEGEDEEQETA